MKDLEKINRVFFKFSANLFIYRDNYSRLEKKYATFCSKSYFTFHPFAHKTQIEKNHRFRSHHSHHVNNQVIQLLKLSASRTMLAARISELIDRNSVATFDLDQS